MLRAFIYIIIIVFIWLAWLIYHLTKRVVWCRPAQAANAEWTQSRTLERNSIKWFRYSFHLHYLNTNLPLPFALFAEISIWIVMYRLSGHSPSSEIFWYDGNWVNGLPLRFSILIFHHILLIWKFSAYFLPKRIFIIMKAFAVITLVLVGLAILVQGEFIYFWGKWKRHWYGSRPICDFTKLWGSIVSKNTWVATTQYLPTFVSHGCSKVTLSYPQKEKT